VLVAAQPDLGTALVLAGVAAMILVLAGMEWKVLLGACCAALPALAALLLMVPWRRARMLVFLNPESDPQGAGYHIYQSLIAVGTGGLTGRGYMEGMQKLFYLPEAATDFIFANIAEELGFIGAMFIVLLFACLARAGCARPSAAAIPLRGWPLSASPLRFCCRPSSTSAWCFRWFPTKAFLCR
jgi:cell division protein FtsW